MPSFIAAIDQGTTGSTVLLLSLQGRVLGKATREFEQHFPSSGWVEHDAAAIWQSIADAAGEALQRAQVRSSDCVAIGITNQRETTLLWERRSGEVLHRAIVWQDRRTAALCEELKAAGREALFRQRTGLVLDPYFSGTKMAWLLDHVEGARQRASEGDVCLGTVDSYLVYRLSGGREHVCDVTNASRTLLYDIHRGAWDEELADVLHVPLRALPRVGGCDEVFAKTQGVGWLPDGIPIAGIAGDQQAALFGQTCFAAGDAKCTYGTGAFLLMNTGTAAVQSQHGLLTTIAWRVAGQTTYALEGSAFVAGAAVQWLRDGLGIIKDASEIEALAAQVNSSGDLVFVPALTGLGAPYWDPLARGLMCGINRDTNRAHLARAALEGIALQVADLAIAMAADAGRSMPKLHVDGGAANNNLLMQLQADLLDVPVVRPAMVETTALGAAYLAGLGVGVFADLASIRALLPIERVFKSAMSTVTRDSLLRRWHDGVRRARSSILA